MILNESEGVTAYIRIKDDTVKIAYDTLNDKLSSIIEQFSLVKITSKDYKLSTTINLTHEQKVLIENIPVVKSIEWV